MNSDIRVSIAFRGHRKRRKLRRLVGAEGEIALLDLWIGVAIARPDGNLLDWKAEDIADEAYYEGDPQKFLDALVASGFVDMDEAGGYSMHDWIENQPWAVGAPERSLKGKKNSFLRWCLKEINKKEHGNFKEWFKGWDCFSVEDNTASIIQAYSLRNASSNATSNAPLLSVSTSPPTTTKTGHPSEKNNKQTKHLHHTTCAYERDGEKWEFDEAEGKTVNMETGESIPF